MSRVSNLFRLQNLDQELEACERRLTEIALALGDDANVAAARAKLDQAGSSHLAAQSVAKEAELAVASQRSKLAETERALYSGAVRNPKELQDLQHESESLQRHLATLEDHLLEAMVELEDRERDQEQASADLARAEAQAASVREDLTEESAKVESRRDRVQSEREVALAGVGPKDLAMYAEMKESMGGRVLAIVHDGACGACGLGLAASALQSVRNSAELFRCPQCGRILYSG